MGRKIAIDATNCPPMQMENNIHGLMTPIKIRPSPCPSQSPRGSACKISPLYVAPFCSLSCEDAKATVNNIIIKDKQTTFQSELLFCTVV